jgi:hypothetical protein
MSLLVPDNDRRWLFNLDNEQRWLSPTSTMADGVFLRPRQRLMMVLLDVDVHRQRMTTPLSDLDIRQQWLSSFDDDRRCLYPISTFIDHACLQRRHSSTMALFDLDNGWQ